MCREELQGLLGLPGIRLFPSPSPSRFLLPSFRSSHLPFLLFLCREGNSGDKLIVEPSTRRRNRFTSCLGARPGRPEENGERLYTGYLS